MQATDSPQRWETRMYKPVTYPVQTLDHAHLPKDARCAGNAPLPDLIKRHSSWALLLFTIRDHYLFNSLYGQALVHEMESELAQSLLAAALEETGQAETYCIQPNPGELLLIWSGIFVSPASLPDTTYTITLKAQSSLKQFMLSKTGREVELDVGYTTISLAQSHDQQRDFLNAVQNARRVAASPLRVERMELAAQFEDILATRNVTPHYQPIMDFATGDIHGWEALTRGPKDSPLRSPRMLFELAEKLERLFVLEEACRERAIAGFGKPMNDRKLFLNIHPKTMADPNLTPGKTLELLERAGLSPANVVFEITERHSLRHFDLFYRALEHYRSQGFKVAVDDAGAGYSGLTVIADIQPDYIKIDKVLGQGVDRDPVKRALLETFVSFADKIGSRIIAEGIETKALATCLVDMGVHLGQGFYLGRPAHPKPGLAIDPQQLRPVTDLTRETLSCSIPVRKLARPVQPVGRSHLACDAKRHFEQHPRSSSLVVCDEGAPVGLVMEYNLNRKLTTRYGMSLYYKRAVENVMDSNPMVVDASTPIEQTAKLAMRRETLKTYDDIIVAAKGRLVGVVSVQQLMNSLAQVQVEMAKGTNPLSGLPGNVALEQEIERRMREQQHFDLIYADLDNFKVYNDTYGFRNGDLIIKQSSDILSWALRRHGDKDAKLFHIGGDDFVAMASPETSERICLGVVRCFRRLVKKYYCEEDWNRGSVRAEGRDGAVLDYPLVSISLGILDVAMEMDIKEIGARAAHLKKYAKSIPGNAYVRDRRSQPDPACAAE